MVVASDVIVVMVTTAFMPSACARMIDQHAAHQTRGNAKEMAPVLPGDPLRVEQSKKRLVDESGRLKRMPRAFAAHVAGSQPAQLGIHQRHECSQRGVVALAPRPQQVRDRCRRSHRRILPGDGVGTFTLRSANRAFPCEGASTKVKCSFAADRRRCPAELQG